MSMSPTLDDQSCMHAREERDSRLEACVNAHKLISSYATDCNRVRGWQKLETRRAAVRLRQHRISIHKG